VRATTSWACPSGTDRKQDRQCLAALLLPPLLALILTLSTAPYLLLVNMSVGRQEVVKVRGTILELTKHVSRKPPTTVSYTVTLLQDAGGSPLTLYVSEDEFLRLREGHTYVSEWKRGCLGLLYQAALEPIPAHSKLALEDWEGWAEVNQACEALQQYRVPQH